MKLLVTYNIPRAPFQELPSDWEITFPEGEAFSKAELLRLLPDHDILLSIFHAPVDKEIINAGKKLKLISNYGVGYNNIDIQYAREKGISVILSCNGSCDRFWIAPFFVSESGN